MISVLSCVTGQHNIWLVLVAAGVCAVGCWATFGLYLRSFAASGAQRIGWLFLTATAAGSSIWCTHFIAMLAFEANAPVSFDPVLTIISFLVAIGGTFVGLLVANGTWSRLAPIIGGAGIGLAIAAMHYTGMIAYRVQGLVSWDRSYLVASIILAVALSGLAFHLAGRSAGTTSKLVVSSVFMTAIVSLHFTGMTAFVVTPMRLSADIFNPQAFEAMGLAVAVGGLIIVGTGLTSYLIDNRTRSESFHRLRQMALHDALTGIPNRAAFGSHLEEELGRARDQQSAIALVCIDLDRFKEINDIQGHSVGDEVLRVLARRMSNIRHDGEFVARIHSGGDSDTLQDFLARLEEVLSMPMRIEQNEITVGASIGVARFPKDAATLEMLVNNADLAMYRAKSDLTQSICFYDRSMDEVVRARRALTKDLREALEGNQLGLYYQVQTSIATGQISGYEVLLRWKHPERGFIPPVDFIPLAEESGLIIPLGEWVLRTACFKAASWNQPYKIAVNLSPVQLAHTDLPRLVHEILLETGLSPTRLELELTESTIVADKVRTLHILRQIRALGVTIALDDFGTGYSSLETLRAFPFDKIKLDRSFMNEIESNPQAKAIVRAVLALGKSLNIPILAEGIETERQLSILESEGCDAAQGYLLGRPAPLDQIVGTGQISLKAPTSLIAEAAGHFQGPLSAPAALPAPAGEQTGSATLPLTAAAQAS